MKPINRRDFLIAGGVAASAALATSFVENRGEAAQGGKSGIIDTHTHFYDPTRAEGVPWPPKSDDVLYRKVLPADFLKVAEPCGVTGTVVVEASPWVEDNQWLLDLASDTPVILGVIGNLDPNESEFKANLKRFAQHPRWKGIRVQTPFAESGDRKQFIENLRPLAEMGLTLDVNGNSAGLIDIYDLKKEYPDLKVVIEHLPKIAAKDPDLQTVHQKLTAKVAALPNVFAKVSYVLKYGTPPEKMNLDSYRAELDLIWQQFGPDRVLYGSNWPVSDRVCPYETIFGVMHEYLRGRTREETLKFFQSNAITAYNL